MSRIERNKIEKKMIEKYGKDWILRDARELKEKRGEEKMKLGEKIEKELKNYFSLFQTKTPMQEAWTEGFRTGFKRGNTIAYEEATKMLKEIGKKS